ncbi:MAG TPA: hypothetical protein VGR96_03470 [Acidobacteriaceae bacterium]|nr:hypothetical protein [Acidobacteriaceae bacterium]
MNSRIVSLLLPCLLAFSPGLARSQPMTVVAQVQITHSGKQKGPSQGPAGEAVVWLDRLSPGEPDPPAAPPGHFRLVQKDKSFSPHLLVVPLGSTVDFPNLDPFFHNVFSQFNGKRFDLGLYETHNARAVDFDHEGVSYIFCNIHPQMSAVVITLATPYFGIAQQNGKVTLRSVPAGSYEMRVWAEGVDAKQLNALSRQVRIGPSQADLGVIALARENAIPAHKNKFGEDYAPDISGIY